MKTLILAAAAAATLALSPLGASAAPLNPAPIAAQDDAGVVQTHYWGGRGYGNGWGYGRGYHRGWYRHHHRHYGYGYGYAPRFRSYYY